MLFDIFTDRFRQYVIFFCFVCTISHAMASEYQEKDSIGSTEIVVPFEIEPRILALSEQYTNTWRGQFLEKFSSVFSKMPTPQNVARKAIESGLEKLDLAYMENPHINPDLTFFNKFKGPHPFSSKTFTGYYHDGSQLILSMTLTEAALSNAFYDPDFLPFELNGVSGIYIQGRGAEVYDESNEIQLLPSQLLSIVESSDIQAQYDQAIREYFHQHAGQISELNREAFLFHAIEMYFRGLLSAEEVLLIQSVKENRYNDFIARQFNIYGYNSDDIIIIQPRYSDHNNGLLYVPGIKNPLIPFDDLNHLRQQVVAAFASENIRVLFSRHFSLYDRQDGISYSGVDSAMLGLGQKRWDKSYVLQDDGEVIEGDIFVHRAHSTLTRLLSDGHTQIRSNAEVQRDYAIGILNTMMYLSPIVDILAPEVGIPLGIALSSADLSLNIDRAIMGDTEADRYLGAMGAGFDSFFLASQLIPAAIDYLPQVKLTSIYYKGGDELAQLLKGEEELDPFSSIKLYQERMFDNERIIVEAESEFETGALNGDIVYSLKGINLENDIKIGKIETQKFNYYVNLTTLSDGSLAVANSERLILDAHGGRLAVLDADESLVTRPNESKRMYGEVMDLPQGMKLNFWAPDDFSLANPITSDFIKEIDDLYPHSQLWDGYENGYRVFGVKNRSDPATLTSNIHRFNDQAQDVTGVYSRDFRRNTIRRKNGTEQHVKVANYRFSHFPELASQESSLIGSLRDLILSGKKPPVIVTVPETAGSLRAPNAATLSELLSEVGQKFPKVDEVDVLTCRTVFSKDTLKSISGDRTYAVKYPSRTPTHSDSPVRLK